MNRKLFSELLKRYKTTRMSGYDFIKELEKLGTTKETASLIHEAATTKF